MTVLKEFFPIIFAVVIDAIFFYLLLFWFARVRAKNVLRKLTKFHLYLSVVYLLAGIALEKQLWPTAPFSPLRWGIGFVSLFLFYYAYLINLFTILRGSFSLNICMCIFNQNKPLALSDIFSAYGDGKGVSYVKQSRLNSMQKNGFLKAADKGFAITARGRFLVRTYRALMLIFNLAPLMKAKNG